MPGRRPRQGARALDLPRSFTIREHSHRILDLCCGKGGMLCTWARDHGVTGTGVDISTVFLAAAGERAAELGVADQITFVHGDASAYTTQEPVDVAACVGAGRSRSASRSGGPNRLAKRRSKRATPHGRHLLGWGVFALMRR